MNILITPSKNMNNNKANILLKNCIKEIATIEREVLLIAEKFGVDITYVTPTSQSIKNKKFKNILNELEQAISVQVSLPDAQNFKAQSDIFVGLRGAIAHCNFLSLFNKIPGMSPVPVSLGTDPSFKPIQSLTQQEYNKFAFQQSLNFAAQLRGLTVSKLWFRQYRKVLRDVISKHPSNSGLPLINPPLIQECIERHVNLHIHLFFWEFYFRMACKNKGLDLFETDTLSGEIVSKTVNTLRHELYSLNLNSITPSVKVHLENLQYLRNKFIHGLIIEFAKKSATIFGKQYNGGSVIQLNLTTGDLIPLSDIYQNSPQTNIGFSLFGLYLHLYGSGIDNDVIPYKAAFIPHLTAINNE